ncbi:hypothetical protein K488DRAFT_53375 [Vararia minispora EC-137]|uniref:Uncharacterized protein n=1 Tax=Vararia minispora EC-137 TaxID=1314806 RepID=A0ACB8QGU8_9AGAM|nr:hypothetical protein K488DRAFT_53375 [Vararia minispora EC-137]
MCHRQLKFHESTTCGHLIFVGDVYLDCNDPSCRNSKAHPSDCPSCLCKRFYTQVVLSRRPESR